MKIEKENSFNNNYRGSGLYQMLGETHPNGLTNYLDKVFKIVMHGGTDEITRRINEMLAYVDDQKDGDKDVNLTILNTTVFTFIPLLSKKTMVMESDEARKVRELPETKEISESFERIREHYLGDPVMRGKCVMGSTQIEFLGSKLIDGDRWVDTLD